jgi:ABC-type lipoprotein export system ATPase subunit
MGKGPAFFRCQVPGNLSMTIVDLTANELFGAGQGAEAARRSLFGILDRKLAAIRVAGADDETRQAMIEIRQLTFAYPNSGFRLRIGQLRVAKGERVAIVGPSGSGKTTLLNLISGISVPAAGGVNVDETNISGLDDRQRRNFRIRRIGAVFQQFELVDYLSVRENILLPYLITSALKMERLVYERVDELARQTGLTDKLGRRVRLLSQGEQQRVAICRALLPSPTLILADEPTGNLDPANKTRALDLLFEQCQLGELTLVAVTHDHAILGGFDRTIDFADFLDKGSKP